MLKASMKIRTLLSAAIPALLALQLGSCSESPQPVETPKSSTAPASASGNLPPGHPMPGATAEPSANEAKLAGTIVLDGEKFSGGETTVFVSVRPKGQKAPWLSRKYPMQSPQIAKNAAGAKVLSFELRSADPKKETFNSNAMNDAPAGIELELYACVKAGGFVDSPTLCDAAAPFEKGKLDYALTLKLP
jgi:hypothetical protein